MTPPIPVRIGEEEVREDRFSRFRLIPWWDQAKLQSARVLVIGAGETAETGTLPDSAPQ